MHSDKGCELKNKRPVMALLDLLGRRWALRILWELKEGALTFRSLQERCGGISPTVMNKRIAEMRDAKNSGADQGRGVFDHAGWVKAVQYFATPEQLGQ